MRVADQVTDEDRDLLDELGVDTAPTKKASRTPREERIIAGFEEIERFVEENGRAPQHGEENDIFERIYAVRLDAIRESEECREVLQGLDRHGLLKDEGVANGACVVREETEEYGTKSTDEELLAELGVGGEDDSDDITQLKHVRSVEEIRAAEEIAQRTRCEDFGQFRLLFEAVQSELASGNRKTIKYQDNAEIKKGDLFILDGQKVLVAEMGETFVPDHGRPDSRLRVIFDNGTESDLLLRSLQRALNKDKVSRRITDPELGPLFSSEFEEDDLASGTIYVLRSLSEEPFISEIRDVLHKIGITGGEVKKRIANAKKDPTYLLADVEVVATFQLANVNRKKLETILHQFFAKARLDLKLKDRFGFNVEPREWFLVPLPVIQEAIEKMIDGTIEKYRYDPEDARIVER